MRLALNSNHQIRVSNPRSLATSVFLIAFFLASFAGATRADNTGGYCVVSLSQMDPDATLVFMEDAVSAEATLDSAAGIGLELGYRISPRVGFGLDASYAELDVDLTGSVGFLGFDFLASDALETATLTLALDFFFLTEKPVNIFIGALAGGVAYGNLDLEGFEDLVGEADVVGDVVFGGRLGADVQLGGNGWFFRAAVRKLFVDAELEGDVRATTSLDPLVASLGFGYVF